LRVEGVGLGERRVSLEVTAEGTVLDGLPPDVEVVTTRYRPQDGSASA
jgi:hypothetical protein